MDLISLLDLDVVLPSNKSGGMVAFSQPVLFSLVYQLSLDMRSHSHIKSRWLARALPWLNIHDVNIRDHCHKMLPAMYDRIRHEYYELYALMDRMPVGSMPNEQYTLISETLSWLSQSLNYLGERLHPKEL